MRAGREEKLPVYVGVSEIVEGAILRGDYGPGDRLPTEQALALEHGINRHTAAQALNHLQEKGLVTRVERRGTFVRPERIDYRVAEKMGFSDSVSRVGLKPARKVLKVWRHAAYGGLARGLGIPLGEPMAAYESVGYAGEIPIVYGTAHFREEVFPGVYELLGNGFRSARGLIREHYGKEIHRAVSTIELEPADLVVARRLRVGVGASTIRYEALEILEDGTPAQWNVGYWRGDVTRVRVEHREVRHEHV